MTNIIQEGWLNHQTDDLPSSHREDDPLCRTRLRKGLARLWRWSCTQRHHRSRSWCIFYREDPPRFKMLVNQWSTLMLESCEHWFFHQQMGEVGVNDGFIFMIPHFGMPFWGAWRSAVSQVVSSTRTHHGHRTRRTGQTTRPCTRRRMSRYIPTSSRHGCSRPKEIATGMKALRMVAVVLQLANGMIGICN